VAQIAWEVGYGDEAAFRKIFRRVVGLAPGAYRLRFRPAGVEHDREINAL
jgi:transcriptional regulator GlxA family with amidase domain